MSTPAQNNSSLCDELRNWQDGDQKAGDRFGRAVRQRMSAYMQRRGWAGTGVSLEDVFHDVFLTFLGRYLTFEPLRGDASILAWFQISLKRRMLDRLRRIKRQEPLPDEPAQDPHAIGVLGSLGERDWLQSSVRKMRHMVDDRTHLRVQRRTRERLLALADHVDAVVSGAADPCGTRGELARRFGWDDAGLSTMTTRLGLAAAGNHAPSRNPQQRRAA